MTAPRRPPLRDRLQYGFDTTMSRGTPALVAWLALVTVVLVTLFTVVVLVGRLGPENEDGERSGVVDQAFKTLLHALDPGTVAGDIGGWPFLVAMFAVTLAGLFVVSALIGVIATGLDAKIEDLRKGRSRVIEREHTLILGWSETIFTILGELRIANESEKRPVVVILAPRDRVEMEDAIRAKAGDMGNTRVVCRTGSPFDVDDLRVVSPQDARSVIVLSPETEDPDAQVIKAMLALTRGPLRPADRPHRIVAEIEDPANLEAARLVGGEEAVVVDKSETVSRLIVQTARQSGLSVAYVELLDFAGEEIYFREDPTLTGWRFGDALHAYEDCSVIGLQRADDGVELNPPADRVIAAGERVIAIAEDDERLLAAQAAAPNGAIEEALIRLRAPEPDAPGRTLLLGWNRRAGSVVRELDGFVAPGSTMTVVARGGAAPAELAADGLRNLSVSVQAGDVTDRRTLERLGVEGYDHVMVLGESDDVEPQRADARTLVTLLHLRDIAGRTGARFTTVSEMLDERDRQLAEVTKVDDVIVSDKIISLLLAQISENRHLADVFGELFAADGSELYMRPADRYVEAGADVAYR
ncbi:MAG TPA: hypothetical protein VF533_07780, partial [Solirubrobacteraceae bacterium]